MSEENERSLIEIENEFKSLTRRDATEEDYTKAMEILLQDPRLSATMRVADIGNFYKKYENLYGEKNPSLSALLETIKRGIKLGN